MHRKSAKTVKFVFNVAIVYVFDNVWIDIHSSYYSLATIEH